MQLLYSGIAKSKEYVLKYFINENVVEFFSIGGDAATATLKFLLSERCVKVWDAASALDEDCKGISRKGINERRLSHTFLASTCKTFRYAKKDIKYAFRERTLITNNFY